MTTNLIGDLPGYGTVWYYPNGIANILSLYHVANKMHVQYDSAVEDAFIVWKDDGTCNRFIAGTRGLYYLDTSSTDMIDDAVLIMDSSNPDSIEQVELKKQKYTQRQIKDAYNYVCFKIQQGSAQKQC